ncbi:uncharacterized protein LOC135709950 [Ochlerotatus camptorhynchus]|uniref:uncharacterized protein LOC135709950 n=1 Tax=Ochlerotatus camptorhynchus TaxID=644619 RepID=UPI0031DD6692
MKRFKPIEDQRLLAELNAELVQIKTKLIQIDGALDQVLLIRTDNTLLCYKFNRSAKLWSYLWKKEAFFTASGGLEKNPWLVSADGFVVTRMETGIHIYKFDKNLALNHLVTDGRYHDAYGWSQPDHVLLIGYFYADPSKIGICSRNGEGKISFEAVIKEEALKRSQLPIWKMDTDPNVPAMWNKLQTDISLAYVDSSPQQAFVSRTSDELSVFKFGKNHLVEKILTFSLPFSSKEGDNVFFGKFSSEKRMINNVLHMNETGLTGYRYDSSTQKLEPIMYAAQFAGKLGWTPSQVETIVFEDIDGDGLDEMLFCSPSGFNVIKISSEEILAEIVLSEKDFEISNRHVKAFVVPKVLQGVQQIVSVSEKGLMSFKLQLLSDVPADFAPSESEKEIVETSIPLLSQSLKYRSVLPLHDQLDFTGFIYPRNPLLGTLDFSVPLVEIPNSFGITMSQAIKFKEYGASDVLGPGWSLPVDCIYIDRQGSIYSIDHNYYLVKSGMQSQLYPKFEGSRTNDLSFTLNGSPNVEIKFYKSQNKWEVKTKHELYSYGTMQNVDWLQWEPGSEEWPVVSNTTAPVKAKPFTWFLSKREDNHGNYLKFVYAPEYGKLSTGVPYVQKLDLLKITSSNGDSVRFSYDLEHNNKLLTNIHTRTASYTQNIQFQYSVIEKSPRLTSISQRGIPVLQFRYKGPKSEMTEIVYPNGLISKFSYSFVTFPTIRSANKFDFFSDVQIVYGPNYLLVGGKTEVGQVRIKARDVVGSETTQMSGLLFPALGKEPVSRFQILTAEQFFVVVLDHENHKEVCLFRQESNGWSSDASYMKLSKDSTLQMGKSFVLVRNDKKLAVLQYSGKRWDIKPVVKNIANGDIIQAFSYAYVVYNDLSLSIGFQSDDGTWNIRNVSIGANLVRSSLLVFDQFQTDQKTIDNLKNAFKEGILHIHHNAVIIRTLSLEGNKIYLRLHFKIFNNAYELFNDETISILVEDLDQYLLELPSMDDNFFKIGYKLVNGKFKVAVKGHTGKIIDEVHRMKGQVEEEIRKHPHASEMEKNKFRKDSYDKLDNELNEIYQNVTASIPFAIDPAKFGVHVNNDNVVAASHKFRFDGSRWNYGKIPETEINLANFRMNIGTSFLLSKSDKNETFKLHDRNEKLVWDLNTPYGDDLLLSYPAFIGVQKNKSAEIFTFVNRKVHQLPDGEFLSRLSNPLAIVTINGDHKSATVRSLKSFTNYHQSVIAKQELFHSDTDIHTTVFEYDSNRVVPFSDGFAFSKSKIIPDGKSQKYGWYEDAFNLIEMKNSSKTVHNSKGVIVKVIKATENEPQKIFDNDKIMTDKMGRFEIVDFRPYRISYEVVSYYGFEPYEVNRIGSNKNWIFENNMITEQNSNHFLRLEPGSSLEGHFKPTMNELAFLFSCWIRTNQTSFNPDIVHLKVVNHEGKLLHRSKGTIKNQITDWQYVEAIYNSGSGQRGIGIDVKLTNPSSTSVDVDHLRLTPLDFYFQANILEPHNGKVRAVLKNSGMLDQKLLDPFGNEIGRVSEKGALDLFIMKSQNCALSKNKNLNSRVEMRPMLGEIDSVVNSHNVIKSLKYKPKVFSLRFLYKLTGSGNIVATLDQLNITIIRNSDQTKLNVNNYEQQIIDSEGEVTALLLPTKLVVWVQGHLIMEKLFTTSFQNTAKVDLRTTGQAFISEVLYMYDPSIKVFYLNKLGLLTQEVALKNQDTINVRHIVYDAIDRPVLKTKWIALQPGANSFFKFNPRVITNLDNILTNRKAEGLANDMNPECQGVPFAWTSYRDDPLEVKIASGLPGKDFSVDGQYSTKFGTNLNLPVLKVLFPQSLGYNYEFELNSGGLLAVQVFDQRKNKVAELVKVVNHDHRLTTFEYDDQNRLLCELPPMYHHKVKTFSKPVPFKQHNLSPEEALLKDLWGKQYKYDTQGRLIEKVTPDSGKQEFIYTDDGLLRFLVQNDHESIQNTIYYTYRYDGKIVERGLVDIPRTKLHEYLPNNATLPKSENYVLFDYGENEVLPMHRNLMQKSRKVSNGVTVTEALLFDGRQQLINQIFVSQNNSLSFNYKFRNDKIYEIEYPFFVGGKQLKTYYDYNLNEKISAVRIGNRIIASLDYTPSGNIKEMQFEPQSKFSYKRLFVYNEPGYLSSIKDKFLSETIDYISNSYGGQSFGDGTVSATKFNATWHEHSDMSRIKLKWQSFLANETSIEQAHLCYDTLQKLGYFDNWNRPMKSFYPSSELQMPLVCNTGSRANHISSIIATKGFPLIYGHRYDYENHKQLVKAKYFQNSAEMSFDPLTQLTFSKHIRGIDASESRNIWNALTSGGFIITDCSNSKVCHAVQGKSLFHPVIANHINVASLEVLFVNGVKSRKDIPEQIFLVVCQIWHKHDPQNQNQLCSGVWKELLSNNLVGSRSEKSIKALNPELKMVLKNYSRHLGDIVGLLHDRFTYALGNSAGDIQSYDIDPNGNHVHFYTGFKRYRLEYVENTNKVSKVFCTDLKTEDMREVEFSMDHDSEGNVTKALHKAISKIVYDPLLKRAVEIKMVDGRTLTFQYDVRGERIFKQVRDKTGNILNEKYYIRDVKGRCLVDYELTYLQNGQDPHVRGTGYIFAEDALVGFIRNDQFYSVFSDHEGSVRLVIKDGEVVAAYDYLPYGQLLRQYNTDPDGSIAYLYTGQEWDEEIGLFNFHARLYDPEIGRFYQTDPKEQYPSPYVYAGNSPISLVDPDGQFAFLAVIAFAAVGGYLGASAANNSFNPTKWKLMPSLIGGVMGGILGGLAPAGIGASFAFLTTTVGLSGAVAGGLIATTSVGFAFLSGASANGNWNPAEWNWSSPATWNSLFSGSITGATLFAGFGKVHAKFISLSGLTDKMIFVGIVTSSTAGVALFAGSAANDWNLSFWEWDWKNPDTIWKVTMGASFGMSVSPDLHKIQTQVTQNVKDFRTLVSSLKAGNMESLVSDAKVYFIESTELFLSIKSTFKDLAKYVQRPGGAALAQTIATSKKTSSNGVIATIKSVLFEASKVVPIGNLTGDLIESLGDLERLEGREGLRRKRDVNCCQLQLVRPLMVTEQPHLLSSSATVKLSLFSDVFRYLNTYFKPRVDSSQPEAPFTDVGFLKMPQKLYNSITLNNCYHFKMEDQSTRVRCYGLDSQYDIFPTLESDSNLVADFYSSCSPIEHVGQPSVVCYGESSNLIFTPKPSINILDVFNGWLMLALVTPTAVKTIKRSARAIFSSTAAKTLPAVSANRKEIDVLRHKMHDMDKKMLQAKSRIRDIKWITHIMEDLADDVEKFSKNSFLIDFNELIDRIGALDEELIELIGFSDICSNSCSFVGLPVTLSNANVGNNLQSVDLSSNRLNIEQVLQKNMIY